MKKKHKETKRRVKHNKEEQNLIDLLEVYKEALFVWDKGEETLEDGTSIRTLINRNTPSVRNIVKRAGCGKTFTSTPPPIVGGVIYRNVDPFNHVFGGPHGQNMVVTITDIIDETIGVIMRGGLPPEKKEIQKQEMNKLKNSKNKVFLVHGQDNEAKQTVARFLEKLGLEVIILHEKRNAGMTIIEKFEKYSDVAYAVVLLTPDDLGTAKAEKDKLKSRARQNVIFELGYFIGKLGRENVCALLKGDLERPSDYDGIIYIGLDPIDAWHLLIAKEIKGAGLNIDLNKAM